MWGKTPTSSHKGVPNLEDRGAQNIHSLDGTKYHPTPCDSWNLSQLGQQLRRDGRFRRGRTGRRDFTVRGQGELGHV